MLKSTIFIAIVTAASIIESADTDVCSQPPDSGVCHAMFMAWYYNGTVDECRMFVYGGCGEIRIDSRRKMSAIPYAKKLIQLHPPQNVTVAYAQYNRIYLYWYPPINYKLHDPYIKNGTSIGPGYSVNGSSNGTKVTHVSVPVIKKSVDQSDSSPATKSTDEISTTVKPEDTTKGNTSAAESNSNSTSNGTDTGEDKVTASLTEEVTEIAGTNLSITDYIGKDKVPFHFARLTHYVITVQLSTGKFFKNVTVPGNVTEHNLTGLQHLTEYSITVSAVYLTNSTLSAKAVTAKTAADPSMASNCFCDPFGTKTGYQKCNLSLTHVPWCECKPRHAGLFCEICAHGFYRTARSMPCHSCPCPKTFSTGSCHFIEGYLHCITCKEEYAGNLCHRCANGYYRDHRTAPSKCVKCDKCHNVKSGLTCDPFTGKCLNCYYNTTGDKCDKCLDGFEGDPINNVSCTPISEKQKSPKSPSVGIVAAIVVGTIVLLSGIAGFIVYKRSHNFSKNKPFWTIEFKEDHEDVNFSAVPEDELERQHDDMSFYESQSKAKNKLPPYSQLKEDI